MNTLKKDKFLQRMSDFGDAVVTYRSPVSRRLKYVVATADFSPDYINNRPLLKQRKQSESVLMFCWDTDTFKYIDVQDVQRVEPLSKVVSRGV